MALSTLFKDFVAEQWTQSTDPHHIKTPQGWAVLWQQIQLSDRIVKFHPQYIEFDSSMRHFILTWLTHLMGASMDTFQSLFEQTKDLLDATYQTSYPSNLTSAVTTCWNDFRSGQDSIGESE